MLLVTIGTRKCTTTTMENFLIVKTHSSYNAIIRCPKLNYLKLVILTYHLKMKFPIENGIGVVCGEQVVARVLHAGTIG